MKLRTLIRQIIKEELKKKEFAPAPKMGDIDPTDEPDSKRPGMSGRPRDGMDVTQQHKMLNAGDEEEKQGDGTDYEVETSDGHARKIHKERTFDNTDELVDYTLDEEEEEEPLEEVNAISTGGGGLQSSGQIAGGGSNAWNFEEREEDYDTMWSDHKPGRK